MSPPQPHPRRSPSPAPRAPAPSTLPPSPYPSPAAQARALLDTHGPEGVPTRELLTVLLAPAGHGRAPERDADLLLAHFVSLRALGAARVDELCAASGLPPPLALRLEAAFALGRRIQGERLERGQRLTSGVEIFAAYAPRLRDLKKERFLSVLLDGRSRVQREDIVSEGTLTASLVHPREVFAPALRDAACALVLIHNHPSGDPEPSPEDLEITRRLAAVGELLGIRVVDHVVIGESGYVSFAERGLLP